jgi:hypothetical protein
LFEGYSLLPDQQELLKKLVEAHRNVPRNRRQKFMMLRFLGGEEFIRHPGLPSGKLDVFHGDMEILAEQGLLTVSYSSQGTANYDVHPRAYEYYAYLQEQAGNPIQRIEKEIVSHLDSEGFQRRHPAAYRHWTSAAELFVRADSDSQWTIIGHHCREAVQEFASDLIDEHHLTSQYPEKNKTVDRIRAVLDTHKTQLGERTTAALDALVHYWGTVSDLIQRQEHGSQAADRPLVWEDARRVVFQTAIVMFEIDRAVQRTR